MKSKTILIILLINCLIFFNNSLKINNTPETPAASPAPSKPENHNYYRIFWGIASMICKKEQANMGQCLPAPWVGLDPNNKTEGDKKEEKDVEVALTKVQANLSTLVKYLNDKLVVPCKDRKGLIEYVNKHVHHEDEKDKKSATDDKSKDKKDKKDKDKKDGKEKKDGKDGKENDKKDRNKDKKKIDKKDKKDRKASKDGKDSKDGKEKKEKKDKKDKKGKNKKDKSNDKNKPSQEGKKRRLFIQRSKSHSKIRNKNKEEDKIVPFDKLKDHFIELKKSISGMFLTPILARTSGIVDCLSEKYDKVVKDIKDTSKVFKKRLEQLSKKESANEVLVTMVCNWHNLGMSIEYLNGAMKQGNELTRHQGIGYFVGKLAICMADD